MAEETLHVMAEQTCEATEPAPVNIFHDSDTMWTTRHHFLVSKNQSGPILGHYMQIDGSSVLADARANDQKAKLKIHRMIDNSLNTVVMLESVDNPGWVVAIDKDNEKVIAKAAPKQLTDYKTLNDVIQQNPEMVFYKKPKFRGSDICYFESYLSDKKRILGFDVSGKPLDPTKVDPVEIEAQFMVFPGTSKLVSKD